MNHVLSLVLAFCTLFLTGCAAWQTSQPVTPVSYQASREQIPRQVGKLRRLAAIPLHQEEPSICSETGRGVITLAYEDPDYQRAASYLSARKGYEIVELDPAIYADRVFPPANAEFLRELSNWSAGSSREDVPGPHVQALVSQARHREMVDGVLIFHIHHNCLIGNSVGRLTLGVLTLGLNELLPDPKSKELYTIYRASILEAITGRPVWRKVSIDHAGNIWTSGRQDALSYEEDFFNDLEAAIPKILTR